jgi:hypothetical protein
MSTVKVIHVSKPHDMMACGSMEVQLHAFLTPALDGGRILATVYCCDCFVPRERSQGIHWIGGWLVCGVDVDPLLELNSNCSVFSHSLFWLGWSFMGYGQFPYFLNFSVILFCIIFLMYHFKWRLHHARATAFVIWSFIILTPFYSDEVT